MKKVGILTLSASDNCGSVLQTYALQIVIKEYINLDVEVINFISEASEDMYDIFPKWIFKHPRSFWYRIKNYTRLKNSKNGYRVFKDKYLNFDSKKCKYADDLKEISDKYDTVITGSDQVWNVSMRDHDNAFFLNWAKSKKVAYAPSLGGHDLEEANNYSQIVKWLGDFDAISVRENKGKECLERTTNEEIPLVLDPTLLLTPERWRKIVDEPIVKGDYIFYYSWAYNEDCINDIVKMDSDKTGLQVYVIDALKWTRNSEKKWKFKLCDKTGPEAFLNLMFYAKKCYVQSFHGMIFAYQFKKNVWLLDSNKDLEKMDTRLKELLKQIDMEERVVTPYNNKELNLDSSPDYCNKLDIKVLRENSLDYLRNNLGR